MRKLILLLSCVPFFSFSQSINKVDAAGKKQGVWQKTYESGKLRYKGQFNNDIPNSLFY